MMEGYGYEVVGDDILEYKCPICLMLLREAMLLPCSHCACKDCLTRWEQRGDDGVYQCPSCQTIYRREQVFEGKLFDRIITTSLRVRCKQHLQNCEWIGTISEYCEIHQKSCIYEPVACDFPGCNIEVARKNLKSHQENCEYRDIQCNYCMETLPFNQLQEHYDICGYYYITCRQGCGRNFRRMDVTTHIAQECPNTEIPCSYRKMGCTEMVLTRDLAAHMNSSVQQHSDLLLQHTLKLTNEVKDLKQNNETLRFEMHELKESSSLRISQLEQKLEEKVDLHNINGKVVSIEHEMIHRSEELKTISKKPDILESQLEINKNNHKDILLIKNEVKEFKKNAVATSRLLIRSKNWSFDELESLIVNKDSHVFGRIINLRPELALVCDSFYKRSLLHSTCRYNNTACIDVLLENGSVVNYEDVNGMRPIHYAAVYGSIDAAEKLFSVDETLLNSITNNCYKDTPLHLAAIYNQEKFVKSLLNLPDIQINWRDGYNKMADEYDYTWPEYRRIKTMIKKCRNNVG